MSIGPIVPMNHITLPSIPGIKKRVHLLSATLVDKCKGMHTVASLTAHFGWQIAISTNLTAVLREECAARHHVARVV